MGEFDNQKKAGNQGDVIKHVALIAALDKVLDEHKRPTFNYADTFAGYAQNPLIKGNEWAQGIEKLFQRRELGNNKHTKLYRTWYLSRPQLLGGMYPGSALIASDVCARKKKKVHLSLWDTSCAVVENLRKTLNGLGHDIIHTEAQPGEVVSADFLLIDPPENSWAKIRKFLKNHNRPVLIWLPVGVNATSKPATEAKNSIRAREQALKDGFKVTKVLWAKGGRTMGCQLVYCRLPDEAREALHKAVDHVASILGWKCRHYAHDQAL